MHELFEQKRQAVLQHFKGKDFHLGYRKLIDCVLDTENLDYFEELIDLNERLFSSPLEEESKINQSIDFLLKLVFNQQIESQTTPLVEGNQIRKTYGRHGFHLGPLNIQIVPGDIWGLVGENGNGKTTLLRILAKDLSYDSGEVKHSMEHLYRDDYELRSHLIYLPQRTPKWYGSLKDNLKFAASSYGITGRENELYVMMYIIRFGLWPFRNHQWSELSSGYKMRFELARTFLRKPKLLLLDEPLANLDVLAQQLVLEDLQNLAKSLTNPLAIVLSSQQLFEVEKISNKVVFLKQGKPTHLMDANSDESKPVTVLEMDLQIEKDELAELLKPWPLESLSFNGGMYMVTIQEKDVTNVILQAILKENIKITYFRDITNSTRRLFQ